MIFVKILIMKSPKIILIAISLIMLLSCKEEQKSIEKPEVSTGEISMLGSTSLVVTGKVLSDGNSKVTERGIVYGITENPDFTNNKINAGSGLGEFSVDINSLLPGTEYHLRAFAVNSKGVSYGLTVSFTTEVDLPSVTTNAVTDITFTTATIGGEVSGGSIVSEKGICISTNQNPTIDDRKISLGTGNGVFSGKISVLTGGEIYFIRAFAVTNLGVTYGDQISFSTPKLIDIDGNAYKVVEIGNQIWMAENLKTSHYQNGDTIPETADAGSWISKSTGAFCYYNNDSSNNKIFGKLYNWFTITDQRKVCPNGWHVPSIIEFDELSNFLGGAAVAGEKLKLTGEVYWRSPNIATNETGFSAVASGARGNPQGDFGSGPQPPEPLYGINIMTSNDAGGGQVYLVELVYNQINLRIGTNYQFYGMSIRCLKD